jgi:hypothetical protein
MTGPVGVIRLPQESFMVGGVGVVCASLIQATVEPPLGGRFNAGGATVYVYTHWKGVPAQSKYVQVYVLVPEQTGSGPTTGPVGVTGLPQESFTFGGVGTTCASLTHATFDPSSGGRESVEGVTVYV